MHAFVTGAGRGVGRAIALRFARDGYAVAVAGRSEPQLQTTSRAIVDAGGKAIPVLCDVASREAVARALARAEQEFGPIDVLVNNAGISESASFVSMDDGVWDRTIAVNLTGTYHCMRAVAPGMFVWLRRH